MGDILSTLIHDNYQKLMMMWLVAKGVEEIHTDNTYTHIKLSL